MSAEYPNFDFELDDMPNRMMSGEVQRLSVRLKNTGPQPIRQFCVWTSHPSFFHFQGMDHDLTTIYPEVDNPGTVKSLVSNVVTTVAPTWLPLPGTDKDGNGGSLSPNGSLSINMWIRGDRVGNRRFELMWGCSSQAYNSESDDKAVIMRTLCLSHSCMITPSLRINAFVRPSQNHPKENILGVEVENLDVSPRQINLIQATSVSHSYRLQPILDISLPNFHSAVSVAPGQTNYLFYRIEAIPQSGTGHNITSPEEFFVKALHCFIYNLQNPPDGPNDIDLYYSNIPFSDIGVGTVDNALQSYLLKARLNWRKDSVAKTFPFVPSSQYSQVFPLYESRSIDFILFWRNTQSGDEGNVTAYGHHSITGIDLGNPKNYFKEALLPPVASMPRTLLAETIREQRTLINSIRQAVINRAAHDILHYW